MIDQVRSTVLYMLNKDNNGYITPDEFNKYAYQAQMEVFTAYFDKYNFYTSRAKMGRVNEGYADLAKEIYQNISLFNTHVSLTKTAMPAVFSATVVSGAITAITIKDGGVGYPPNSTGFLTIAGTGSLGTATYLVDAIGSVSTVTIVTAGSGQAIVTVTMPSSLTSTVYNLPTNAYMFNSYFYNGKEIVAMDSPKLKLLNNSNLTSPTTNFPYYTMVGNSIEVYPTTITGTIDCYYARYPKTPMWTYSAFTNGEPIFNSSDPNYQDFEVAYSEFETLVVKILQYAGVQIREADVVAYTASINEPTPQT